jgi:hypothetical protein
LAAGLLTSGDIYGASLARAASASDFDAGYIVSDDNFYDGSAMTASDVQSFLLSRNSRCNSSYACLWGYGQSTPSMPANAYCQAMSGSPGELGSSIIARVGSACGISQRALLVLLEKEQSLVTSSTSTRSSFDGATGFGCPDSAPCNPSYGGFFYQVYYAARQFQVYRAQPRSFNFQPNAWNTVLFHPDRGCGSSSIFIRNAATAGLYDYTPYQPNAAALANLYGTGDSCSAYGNRNFWRLWTDWFGSPTQDPYNLIRLAGTSTVYLASGGKRYRFSSPEMLAQYSILGAIHDLATAQFNSYALSFDVQRAFRTSDGTAYFVDQNRRYRFTDCAQALDFGQFCDQLPTLSSSQVRQIPDGGWLNRLVRLTDGSVWLMQGGARRETPDPSVLAPYGIPPATTSLSNFSIGPAQIGAPVVGAGLFTDGQGHYAAATYGGTFVVAAAAATGALAGKARALQPFSFQRLPVAGTLPLRLASSGRFFIAVDGGWLEVDGATYGGTSAFTSLQANAWTGIPIVGSAFGPHFIRERSSSQVYLVSGGSRQPVADQGAQNWITSTYGVNPRVWVSADGALVTVDLPTGSFVNAAGTSTNYLIDQGSRYRFRDCAQLESFGQMCGKVATMSAAQLDKIPLGGNLTDLIRLPDGSTWLMQAGQRRETPNPNVLQQYGISTTPTILSAGSIGSIAVGPPVISAGVYSDGNSNYAAATYGGTFALSAAAAAGQLASSAYRLQSVSFQKLGIAGTLPLRMSSDRRFFLAVDGGWLEEASSTFGGSGAFTNLPSGAWTGVPLVGAQFAPLFVRERSAAQVYLISGGTKQPVADQGALNWISINYGVNPRVWVAADHALDGVG